MSGGLTPPLSVRLNRWLAGAFIALAAALLAPAEARATCGDYLWMGNHAEASHADPESDAFLNSDFPAKERQPCRGPQCRRGSELPAPPVPTVTVRIHDVGCLTVCRSRIEPTGSRLPLEHAHPRPVVFGPSIFRPPQA